MGCILASVRILEHMVLGSMELGMEQRKELGSMVEDSMVLGMASRSNVVLGSMAARSNDRSIRSLSTLEQLHLMQLRKIVLKIDFSYKSPICFFLVCFEEFYFPLAFVFHSCLCCYSISKFVDRQRNKKRFYLF